MKPEWQDNPNWEAIDQAIDILNSALEVDSDAINRLFVYSIAINGELLTHPTIQCGTKHGISYMRVLGLINGLFGVDDNQYGHIDAECDNEGTIQNFCRYSKGNNGNE